jgi:hypothetical protein
VDNACNELPVGFAILVAKTDEKEDFLTRVVPANACGSLSKTSEHDWIGDGKAMTRSRVLEDGSHLPPLRPGLYAPPQITSVDDAK